MNIGFLGDFSANLDEGYKNTTYYLTEWLERRGHRINRLNTKQIFQISFWKDYLNLSAPIIHLIVQPTNSSLLFILLTKIIKADKHIVVSALRPEGYFKNGNMTLLQIMFLRLCKPDLVLLQNPESASLFKQSGYATAFMPNGVDIERFSPVSNEQKSLLRKKHHLEINRPIIVSVGHLEYARNLIALERLVQENIQVLIVGGDYMGANSQLIEQLEKSGLIIFKGYQSNIEELYQLADCYVFPVPPGNSLCMPLSVLEAMACNLPVVTTRFIGLQKYFNEGIGYRYMDQAGQLVDLVHEVLSPDNSLNTRDMVKRFSWQSIVCEIEGHYSSLLKGRPCD